MRTPLAAALAATFLVATVPFLDGCGRGGDEARAPGATAPAESPPAPAPAPVTATPPAPVAQDDVPPPEGVLRAYVWDCEDGGKLRMKNLFRENAITLEMHEGPRKLSQVVAASGAKYSDGTLSFWTKGGTAILERAGSAPVNCRELRRESLIADARERGVRYRGTGNEPGWLVEIGPGAQMLYAGNFGEDRRVFEDTTERAGEQPDARVFAAGTEPDRVVVTVTRQACQDDMSGEMFDYRMDLEAGGRSLRGCATSIQ